jgi:hypothetical protein
VSKYYAENRNIVVEGNQWEEVEIMKRGYKEDRMRYLKR